MSSSSVITDVVRAVPKEENNPFVPREKILYPLSGTITRDVTVVILNGRNGDETRTKHVVITFNGTQFVTMTVDGEPIEVKDVYNIIIFKIEDKNKSPEYVPEGCE